MVSRNINVYKNEQKYIFIQKKCNTFVKVMSWPVKTIAILSPNLQKKISVILAHYI
jgi:hypothetical protein